MEGTSGHVNEARALHLSMEKSNKSWLRRARGHVPAFVGWQREVIGQRVHYFKVRDGRWGRCPRALHAAGGDYRDACPVASVAPTMSFGRARFELGGVLWPLRQRSGERG